MLPPICLEYEFNSWLILFILKLCGISCYFGLVFLFQSDKKERPVQLHLQSLSGKKVNIY